MTIAEDERGRRRELARGGAIGLIGSVFSAGMGFVLIIVLGSLGDYRAGIVLQAIGVYSIALGVARLGMDSAAVWIMPRLKASRSSHTSAAAVFVIGSAALGGLICAILIYGALVVLASLSLWQPDVISALAAITWTLPLASAFLATLATLRGLGDILPYVLIGSIAVPALRPATVLLVVAVGGGVALVALGWASPVVIALGAALVVVRALLRRSRPVGAPTGALSGDESLSRPRKAIARYAGPRVLSSSLEQLLLWLDVVLVGAIAGAADAGVYGTASRFVAAALIVDTAIRLVVSPEFSRLLHLRKHDELRSIYSTATRWLVLFSSPIILTLVIFAPLVLSLVGAEFIRGAGAIVILGIGALVTLLAGNIHSVLLMSGRSGWAAFNKAVVVSLNIGLIWWWVPLWGINGAAAAWAVCMMMDALLAWAEIRILIGIRIGLIDGVYPLLITLVTVGLPALAVRLWWGPTWPALLVAVAVGGVLFVLWCRHDRERLHFRDLRGLAARRAR